MKAFLHACCCRYEIYRTHTALLLPLPPLHHQQNTKSLVKISRRPECVHSCSQSLTLFPTSRCTTSQQFRFSSNLIIVLNTCRCTHKPHFHLNSNALPSLPIFLQQNLFPAFVLVQTFRCRTDNTPTTNDPSLPHLQTAELLPRTRCCHTSIPMYSNSPATTSTSTSFPHPQSKTTKTLFRTFDFACAFAVATIINDIHSTSSFLTLPPPTAESFFQTHPCSVFVQLHEVFSSRRA